MFFVEDLQGASEVNPPNLRNPTGFGKMLKNVISQLAGSSFVLKFLLGGCYGVQI